MISKGKGCILYLDAEIASEALALTSIYADIFSY